MEIEEIKSKMLNFQDFFGGQLLYIDDVEDCKSKEELERIIDRHGGHLEDLLSDAKSHLDKFKQKCELGYYDKSKYTDETPTNLLQPKSPRRIPTDSL